jgi:hypothetical protein
MVIQYDWRKGRWGRGKRLELSTKSKNIFEKTVIVVVLEMQQPKIVQTEPEPRFLSSNKPGLDVLNCDIFQYCIVFNSCSAK